MKVGDKLICKKTFRHDGDIFFIENKSYEISYFDITSLVIKTEKNLSDIGIESIDFKLYTPNTDNYQFEEYFYTPQELRKTKFQKILKNESI